MAVEDLNPKQRSFVEAYLGQANFNATEAARIAGYEYPKQQGSRLLTNVDIQTAVQERLNAAKMDADTCLARLSEQAFNTASRFIKGSGHNPFVDLDAIREAGLMHLVKGIKHTRDGVNIEFYNAQKALELVCRHHGLLVDKSEVSGPNGGPIDFNVVTGYDVVKPPEKASE